jgi:hypothetical protein
LFELAQNLVFEKIDEWQIFEDKDYISDEALAM